MKKRTLIRILSTSLATAVITSSAIVKADNCRSYWPKLPYNCVAVKVPSQPSERADFSAFETGNAKTGTIQAADSDVHYRLKSVSRATARKLRSQD